MGFCNLGSTVNDIRGICQSVNVEPKALENLPTKATWHQAYKLTVQADDSEKLLVQTYGPEEHAYKLTVQADDGEKLLVQTYGPEEYLRANYLQQRTVEEYLLL